MGINISNINIDNTKTYTKENTNVLQDNKTKEQSKLKEANQKEVNQKTESKNGYDEKLDKLIKDVNKKFKLIDREFSYEIHEKTQRYIVAVKDADTGKLIKEIPSKESLDLFAKILETAGLLIDEKS